MHTPLYSITDFCFSYPFSTSKVSITGEISINQGDVVLITGASGAGKSTLLYALKGVFPDIIKGNLLGMLKFKGKPIGELSGLERLKIGIVFQNPNHQIINRLVIDELAFGLENLGLNPEQIITKINQISEEYQLSHLLNRELVSLSLGEKQRIILLSIILTEPEVLLLDEPTAFLDREAASLFMQLVKQVSYNKTIIIIEHNLDYVQSIINRVFNVDEFGVIQEVPLSQFIAIEYKQIQQPISVKNSATVLRVSNLSFGYNLAQLLFKNLNFSLNEGECLGIVGSSGIGKSTLLRLLAGLETNYNGSITVYNQDIRTVTRKWLYSELGLLLQNSENHFLYTSVAKELNNDTSIIELFGLTQVKNHNPFTLSEGQKRRLSLAILFSKRCKIYLLDEPSFGQDIVNKSKLIELIRTMQQSGASFIIVSHDEQFVNSLCNQVFKLC